MLSPGNIRRCLAATLILLFTVAGPAGGVPRNAQPAQPDAADVAAAYLDLEAWVDALSLPDPDDPASRRGLEHAAGVCVILRHNGRVLGTGADMQGDDLMLRRAAGRALSATLADRTIANLPEDLRDRVGRQLTIELEVAGPLQPLPGRTWTQIAGQLEPGLDGVLLRRGEARGTFFPAQMLAANTAGRLGRLLPALAVDLGLPALEPAELRRRHGLSIYSFRTVHLVQRAPGRAPFLTYRGEVLVPEDEVTAERIASFAESLTTHLITPLWPGDEPFGLMGDYEPVADRYVPLTASPRDQALTAFALGRYAAAPQLHWREALRARDTAVVLLRDLAAVAEGESDPLADPAACAAIVYAVSALPEAKVGEALSALHRRAAAKVIATIEAADEPAAEDESAAPQAAISAHGRAMLAGAMARLMVQSPDLVEAASVRRAIDAAWRAVPKQQQITLLPWIGFAELEYADAAATPIARAEELRRMRALLEASRVKGSSADKADLAGGFALTAGRRARPDAQTTRPAAYLAAILREPALTPADEVPAAVDRHLSTMRFLIQLAVDDDLLWTIRTPQRAKGGIRAATWDLNQPVAAQAMGLLTAAETLISLDSLAEKARKP